MAAECPRDPNYRSRFDLVEEMGRIEKIASKMHKTVLPTPELSAQALNVLGLRSDQDQFNDSNVATDLSSLDSELLDEESTAFPDIQHMKSRVPKGTNLVSFQHIEDSEAEVGRKNTRRTPSFQIMSGRKSPVS